MADTHDADLTMLVTSLVDDATRTLFRDLLRLLGAVLLEVHDEWQVAERRYFSDESMKPLTATNKEVPPALAVDYTRIPHAEG